MKLILLTELAMKDINEHSSDEHNGHACCNRRSVLKTALGVTVAGIVGGVGLGVPTISYAAALTKEQRDKLTPDQIIAGLKQAPPDSSLLLLS
jgi:hypothetical protein